MRCPHCGAEVQGNFCEYCGSSLNVDNGTGAAGASPFESGPEEKPWKTEPPISPFEAESSGNETQQEAPETYQGEVYEPGVSPKDWRVCMILSVIPIVGRILQFAVPQNSPVYTLAALLILVSGACCFYTGKLGMGILYTLTGGLFSIGNIYDIIQLNAQRYLDKERRVVKKRL